MGPDVSAMILLPNKTWVHLFAHSKTNMLTPVCGEWKCSINCKAPS